MASKKFGDWLFVDEYAANMLLFVDDQEKYITDVTNHNLGTEQTSTQDPNVTFEENNFMSTDYIPTPSIILVNNIDIDKLKTFDYSRILKELPTRSIPTLSITDLIANVCLNATSNLIDLLYMYPFYNKTDAAMMWQFSVHALIRQAEYNITTMPRTIMRDNHMLAVELASHKYETHLFRAMQINAVSMKNLPDPTIMMCMSKDRETNLPVHCGIYAAAYFMTIDGTRLLRAICAIDSKACRRTRDAFGKACKIHSIEPTIKMLHKVRTVARKHANTALPGNSFLLLIHAINDTINLFNTNAIDKDSIDYYLKWVVRLLKAFATNANQCTAIYNRSLPTRHTDIKHALYDAFTDDNATEFPTETNIRGFIRQKDQAFNLLAHIITSIQSISAINSYTTYALNKNFMDNFEKLCKTRIYKKRVTERTLTRRERIMITSLSTLAVSMKDEPNTTAIVTCLASLAMTHMATLLNVEDASYTKDIHAIFNGQFDKLTSLPPYRAQFKNIVCAGGYCNGYDMDDSDDDDDDDDDDDTGDGVMVTTDGVLNVKKTIRRLHNFPPDEQIEHIDRILQALEECDKDKAALDKEHAYLLKHKNDLEVEMESNTEKYSNKLKELTTAHTAQVNQITEELNNIAAEHLTAVDDLQKQTAKANDANISAKAMAGRVRDESDLRRLVQTAATANLRTLDSTKNDLQGAIQGAEYLQGKLNTAKLERQAEIELRGKNNLENAIDNKRLRDDMRALTFRHAVESTQLNERIQQLQSEIATQITNNDDVNAQNGILQRLNEDLDSTLTKSKKSNVSFQANIAVLNRLSVERQAQIDHNRTIQQQLVQENENQFSTINTLRKDVEDHANAATAAVDQSINDMNSATYNRQALVNSHQQIIANLTRDHDTENAILQSQLDTTNTRYNYLLTQLGPQQNNNDYEIINDQLKNTTESLDALRHNEALRINENVDDDFVEITNPDMQFSSAPKDISTPKQLTKLEVQLSNFRNQLSRSQQQMDNLNSPNVSFIKRSTPDIQQGIASDRVLNSTISPAMPRNRAKSQIAAGASIPLPAEKDQPRSPNTTQPNNVANTALDPQDINKVLQQARNARSALKVHVDAANKSLNKSRLIQNSPSKMYSDSDSPTLRVPLQKSTPQQMISSDTASDQPISQRVLQRKSQILRDYNNDNMRGVSGQTPSLPTSNPMREVGSNSQPWVTSNEPSSNPSTPNQGIASTSVLDERNPNPVIERLSQNPYAQQKASEGNPFRGGVMHRRKPPAELGQPILHNANGLDSNPSTPNQGIASTSVLDERNPGPVIERLSVEEYAQRGNLQQLEATQSKPPINGAVRHYRKPPAVGNKISYNEWQERKQLKATQSKPPINGAVRHYRKPPAELGQPILHNANGLDSNPSAPNQGIASSSARGVQTPLIGSATDIRESERRSAQRKSDQTEIKNDEQNLQNRKLAIDGVRRAVLNKSKGRSAKVDPATMQELAADLDRAQYALKTATSPKRTGNTTLPPPDFTSSSPEMPDNSGSALHDVTFKNGMSAFIDSSQSELSDPMQTALVNKLVLKLSTLTKLNGSGIDNMILDFLDDMHFKKLMDSIQLFPDLSKKIWVSRFSRIRNEQPGRTERLSVPGAFKPMGDSYYTLFPQ
jgi:hypothetical protein